MLRQPQSEQNTSCNGSTYFQRSVNFFVCLVFSKFQLRQLQFAQKPTCDNGKWPPTTESFVGPNNHSETHCNTFQHTTTLQYTVTYAVTHHNMLQHAATRGNTRQHTATRGNTRQHTVTHCNTLQRAARQQQRASRLQNFATRCNTLHHTTTPTHHWQWFRAVILALRMFELLRPEGLFNLAWVTEIPEATLKKAHMLCFHALTLRNGDTVWTATMDMEFGQLQAGCKLPMPHTVSVQCTSTHCNVLQHTATHCKTPQHTATHCSTHCNTLQRTVVARNCFGPASYPVPHTLCLIPCALPM